MAKISIAALESALRVKQLDRTLTTALPPLERNDPSALAPTEVPSLDNVLRGGLPRGHLSELVGPLSSGRTAVLLQLLAAAARRGEIVALIDTFDRLDVPSAAAAGVDLDRLLWVRGASLATGADAALSSPTTLVDRALDRAIKALNLVLQAGGFGVVAIDLSDAPLPALKRMPFTTWLRVQRAIEGSETAGVVLAPQPLARSAGGVTLALGSDRGRARWQGESDRSRRLAGLDIGGRVISPRRRVDGDVAVAAVANNLR